MLVILHEIELLPTAELVVYAQNQSILVNNDREQDGRIISGHVLLFCRILR